MVHKRSCVCVCVCVCAQDLLQRFAAISAKGLSVLKHGVVVRRPVVGLIPTLGFTLSYPMHPAPDPTRTHGSQVCGPVPGDPAPHWRSSAAAATLRAKLGDLPVHDYDEWIAASAAEVRVMPLHGCHCTVALTLCAGPVRAVGDRPGRACSVRPLLHLRHHGTPQRRRLQPSVAVHHDAGYAG